MQYSIALLLMAAVMLPSHAAEPMPYRSVFTDYRPLPAEPSPAAGWLAANRKVAASPANGMDHGMDHAMHNSSQGAMDHSKPAKKDSPHEHHQHQEH